MIEAARKVKDDEADNAKFVEWATAVENAKDSAEQKRLLNHSFTGNLKDLVDAYADVIRKKYEQFQIYDVDGLRREISNHFNGVYSWKFVRDKNPVNEMLDQAITGSYRNRFENESIRKAFAKEFGFE